MESNRVIAGTIGLFVVICLVGAVLAPMINDWATGERITNEGAGWLRMDYTEVTESSNYSMAVSIAGGTITVTDTNSATQSGADDTIAYASSTLAIWTDSGTIQILGTDPDGDPYYATASSSVNVWYSLVLGQIIKIDGSEDAITFATPTWAYLPLTNGNYAFFDNGTSVQTEEGKPFAAVGGGFAGVYAYNNMFSFNSIPLQLQTTQDTDGLLNGAYWAKPAAQQDQRQLIPISLDPEMTRVDDPDKDPDPGIIRSIVTPTYTDGDWGYDTITDDGETKAKIVSYSGSGGVIEVPSTVGGYTVVQFGKDDYQKTVFDSSVSCTKLVFPDTITKINHYAMYGCTGFTGTLTIPDSVTTIGASAFGGCTGFSGDLVIPASVTYMEGAFGACSGLKGTLVIPDSITNHYSGFNGTKFKTLIVSAENTPGSSSTFPSTITTILDLSDAVDFSQNKYGASSSATVQDNIGDALGYISFVEKGSDPLVPAGAAAVMLAIPVVILGALIVVAATTFIRKE